MNSPVSPFTHRGRGEPDPKWLQPDVPSTPPSKHEHNLFAESCRRIDVRNQGLTHIISLLRETREGLAEDNARAEGGAR